MSQLQQKQRPHRIRNINQEHDNQLSFGDRVADRVANGMGSWKFVITQTIVVILWISGNIWFITHPWDPWPFILLNLVFSTQAAYASPLILMAQNRSASKDRLAAEHDYEVNTKGEEETRQLIAHLYEQDKQFMESYDKLLQQTAILIELAKNKQ